MAAALRSSWDLRHFAFSDGRDLRPSYGWAWTGSKRVWRPHFLALYHGASLNPISETTGFFSLMLLIPAPLVSA